ncbi:MAG: molybdopterin-dependent oxidoreductase [Rhodospirillales bacterium]
MPVRLGLTHWGPFEAVVEDGRVTQTRPWPGSGANPRMIGAIAEALYSPLRIDRPMVRKGWLKHRNGKDRGRDDFVAIGWDEAVRLVAGEQRRVRAEAGDAAIFGGSYGWSSAGRYHHARTQMRRFLAAAGGFTDQAGNYSWGAAQFILPHVLGDHGAVSAAATSWQSIAANCDLFVAFGGLNPKNWHVTSGGGGSYDLPDWTRKARARGVHFVNISPLADDMPDWLDAGQISPRPNTDTAIMLGLAHRLLETGRADLAFLERYCTGWPAFRDYLSGTADGVVKSTVWAAGIADIPAGQLDSLADRMAAGRTMLTATWSLQRADHGEQPYWALIALAAMLGQVGLPGGGFGFGYGSMSGVGQVRRAGIMPSMPMLPNPAQSVIPVARITDMLLAPGAEIDFDGKRLRYPETRLIQWAGGNPFHHHQDLARLERAWTLPETVIVHDSWWTPVARRADIVLPATTTLERNDIGGTSRDPVIFAMARVVAPVGQARNDADALADIAEALGCRDAYTEGRDEAGWLDQLFDDMAARAARAGITPPDRERFWRDGFWRVPPTETDEVMLEDFRRDPEGRPLATPSGRIELCSQRIAGFGYDDCPAHPTWLEPAEWLGRAAEDELHLLSHQPRYRLHSQLGQTEAGNSEQIDGREPALVSPADASRRGIRDGDAVRLWNARGACHAAARISPGLRDGVVILPTGSWFETDEAGTTDLHGNPNILTRDAGTSRLAQGPSAQTALVRMERLKS